MQGNLDIERLLTNGEKHRYSQQILFYTVKLQSIIQILTAHEGNCAK